MSQPHTLLELIQVAPAGNTALLLTDSGIRVTYDSLRKQVTAMADALASMGIGRGDRVATVLPNGLPAIVSFLAGSIAGTAAPLNPGYREEEFAFYLEDTGAKVVLAMAEGADAARKAAAGLGIPVYTLEMDANGVVRILDAPSGKKAAAPAPDDVALVLHTSGSTGRPKRVPIRHRNITASTANIVEHYSLTPKDVSLCVMPLFHVHGLVASTLSTLRSGGTVAVPNKFNPLSFWRTVADSGATWYSAVPTIHNLLLSRAKEPPAGREGLRFIRSCSAALPPGNDGEDGGAVRRSGARGLRHDGSLASDEFQSASAACAKARFGRTRAPESRLESWMTPAMNCPQESAAKCAIKGPNVVSEYENNPEATAKSFTNGWFRTGDQGFLDADGYLTLTGRLKELINRGGEKIGPREIDEVLLAHPNVAEALAFGVPHPMWGEEVNAAVVLREPTTEAAILAFCKERLADFKMPKKLFVVESIPRTATGKIQRGAVGKALAGGQ